MVPNKRGISQSGDQEIMGLITAGSLFECSFVDPLLRLFKPSRVIIRPFEKRDVLCYGVWRPSIRELFRFRLTPPSVYIRSS